MQRTPSLFAMSAVFRLALGLASGGVLFGNAHAQSASAPLTVFAAASLTNAMGDIDRLWQQQGHQKLVLSFGSSSTLVKQIEQGAPADLLASADERWMDEAAHAGAIVASTRRDLLGNSLVLIAPKDHAARFTIGKGTDLAGMLGANGRLAIGDPSNVPAGIYGAQALKSLGLWDQVRDHLAPAENVRATLLLVERGEAPLGIVYATDAAISQGVTVVGTFPAASHDPITYPFALTKHGDTAEARALLDFLASKPARDVFVQYGFVPN